MSANTPHDSDPDDNGSDDGPVRETPVIVSPPRVSRHIQPLGPRVLIRLLRGPDRSESGLFLPAGAKEDHSEALLAEVIEVARSMPKDSARLDDLHDDDDGETSADLGVNVSGIPLGAQVLFAKEEGTTVPWDESLRLLEVRRILAIVETITEDKLQ